MSLLSKAKEVAAERAVEASVGAISALLLWLLALISPAIWPAIAAAVPAQALLPLLLLSLFLNAGLTVLLYSATHKKEPEFQLRFGIYWDRNKNPHCPVCQKPAVYGDWSYQGMGYYCQPCNKVTPLKDPAGRELQPEEVLGQ